MSNEVLIQLNKTDFIGGEVVSGELEVKIDTAIPVRGVRLLFHGYEQSYWSQGAGRVRSSGTGWIRETYSETLDLFKEEMTLFGDPPLDTAALISDSFAGLFASGNYRTLEPGNYRYPFSFTLPDNLPGDYKGGADRSKIQYLVKGYLDIPLKIDIEQTVPLTIQEVYDRSDEQPVSVVNEQSLFESGTSVRIEASLDKNAFFPGDTIDCHLKIENQSGKPVEAVNITLRKLKNLTAKGASTTNAEDVLTKKYQESIPTGETAKLNLPFAVPGNLYPTIVSSRLIQVEYEIVAALEIPWASGLHIPWAMDLEVVVPIVLLEDAGRPGGTEETNQ